MTVLDVDLEVVMPRAFLYTEVYTSVPFGEFPWKSINPQLKEVPGLVSKTWLSGIGTNGIGGFYEFDSVENALAYATGDFAAATTQAGATATTRIFDAEAVAEASTDLKSPFYS
ncbi:YdhR family protein [Streptomyces sioyaensis]|uniref:YdhR family protein n=1 Tax=Streptomyces sioyaensis TaxID=67364 RepID=UPI0036EE2EEA